MNQDFTIRNIKNCTFRQILLDHCKKSFDDFLQHKVKTSNFENEDEEEKHLKFKSRLIGNIRFVGEINTRNILSNQILESVFDQLLQEENINDDIIEGALVLIQQVGKTIDDDTTKKK